MDRPKDAPSGLPETAPGDSADQLPADTLLGDWDEPGDPLDTRILFECNSTQDGRYSAVCVYSDLVVVEDPREPGGRTDLAPVDIVSWEIRAATPDIEVVLRSDRQHAARLPRSVEGSLRIALTTVLGHLRLSA